MDHKLDLLVSELRRYGVSVVAIQETKWFGKVVWQADGHTFLTLAAHCLRMENQQLGTGGLVFSWTRGQQQLGRRLGKSGMLSALVQSLLG